MIFSPNTWYFKMFRSAVSFGDGCDISCLRLLCSTDVIYVSAAGSMLCQIINSLLLLPVSVARPLLSHLLDLLPPLDRLNRLLPAASLLEDQELQWPLHGGRNNPEACKLPCRRNTDTPLVPKLLLLQVHLTLLSQCRGCLFLSRLSLGCGWWTWSAQWRCWWAAAWVGCSREPQPLWRSRIQPTGSKHLFSATAWRWTSLNLVHSDLFLFLFVFFCFLQPLRSNETS